MTAPASGNVPLFNLHEALDRLDDDEPSPPIWLSAEACYGWSCGWAAAISAIRDEASNGS